MCNDSPNKTKGVKSKKLDRMTCAVFSLVYCALFSDVREEILTNVRQENLEEANFHLEDFIFTCMCIPAYTIGNLMVQMYPQSRKVKKALKANPDIPKSDKLHVLSQKRSRKLVTFKDKFFSIMIGAKFLEEYFYCHGRIKMDMTIDGNAWFSGFQLNADQMNKTMTEVKVGKYLINRTKLGPKWDRNPPEKLDVQSCDTIFSLDYHVAFFYKTIPLIFARRLQYRWFTINKRIPEDPSFMSRTYSLLEFAKFDAFYERCKDKGGSDLNWFSLPVGALLSSKNFAAIWKDEADQGTLRHALHNEYLLQIDMSYAIYDTSPTKLHEGLIELIKVNDVKEKEERKKKKAVPRKIDAPRPRKSVEEPSSDSEDDDDDDENASPAPKDRRRGRTGEEEKASDPTSSPQKKKRKK